MIRRSIGSLVPQDGTWLSVRVENKTTRAPGSTTRAIRNAIHRISRIRVPVSHTRDDGGWAVPKQKVNVFVVFAPEAVTTRRYALARWIETVALFHRASGHPADRSEHRTRPPGNTGSALSARSAVAAASGHVARDAQVTFKQ